MKLINFDCLLYETTLDEDQDYNAYINKLDLKTFEANNNNYDKSPEDLKHKTQSRLNNFFIKILDKNKSLSHLTIRDCWVQEYKEGQYHEIHTHDKDLLSFVYFSDCTEHSSEVTFYNLGYPNVVTHRYVVKPEKNKVIVFPGFLPHGVKPNKDNTRRIVSGNLLWQK